MNTATRELPAVPPTVKITEQTLRNFWAKVDKSGPIPDQSKPHYVGLHPCWIWTSKKRGGYGRFLIKRKPETAHRIMWQIVFGSIPEGKCVLHRCDNPSCVNPSHLFCGTRNDNNKDKAKKGRARSISGDDHHSRKTPECMARGDRSGARKHPEKIPRGDNHGRHTMPERTACGEMSARSKMTEIQVKAIRASYAPGFVTLKSLAEEYSLCIATVYQIVTRKTWRHVQ